MSKDTRNPKEAVKDQSMGLQKAMIAANFDDLATAHEQGKKVSSTFVPGNLNELMMCFDFVRNFPEINALQSAMRKKTGGYIMDAERNGHSEDVCTYVKADLGMMQKGNIGPTGKPLPTPDLLVLSYTGCFTFMKWFELVRDEYGCDTAMLHVPYQADGRITDNMRKYVVDQLKNNVIPVLERVSGVKFDIDRLRENLRRSADAEDNLVYVLQSAKNKPSPIDSYFGSIYYCGPIFSAFRGTEDAVNYYRVLRGEIDERLREGKGPVTPEGDMTEERFRLVVEGPPNWTNFRDFWKTAWWWRGRRTGPISAISGRCSTTRAWSWWHRAIPRSAAPTTSTASVMIRNTRWSRWPTIVWAATPTAACRCAPR